jgi:ATP-dependent Lon protease
MNMVDDFDLHDLLDEGIEYEEVDPDHALAPIGDEAPSSLLLYPLDNTVLFPGMLIPLDVPADGDARQVMDTVLDSTRTFGFIGIKAERVEPEHPLQAKHDELFTIGTMARIMKILRLPDKSLRLLIQTGRRFRIERFRRSDTLLLAKVSYPVELGPMDEHQTKEMKVLHQRLLHEVQELILIRPDIPDEAADFVSNVDDPGPLADFFAANFLSEKAERQRVLAALDLRTRVELALLYLTREREMAELGERLHREIADKLETGQREFMIREQIKLLRRELGEERDEKELEVEKIEEALAKPGIPEAVVERGRKELGRLTTLSPEATEYNMLRNYLDWLIDIPWTEETEDRLDLKRTKRILDKHHHGLDQVKERLLEFLAVRIRNPAHKGSILCLCGPPGTGKTSVAIAVAEALGRTLHRVSLGGLRDEAEIKGHRRTYVGAMPGKIVQGIKRAGSMNPVFVLDEIDKLGSDWRGDPSSAMLEVLDPSQNHNFEDHYIDLPIDLSKVFFVATANDRSQIPKPLLDRMEIINLDGYIPEEKVRIARRHLVPRALKEHALTRDDLVVDSAALRALIRGYTREAGVRELNRKVEALARKATAKIVMEGPDLPLPLKVDKNNLHDWLGAPRFIDERPGRLRRPGIAVGLAWTPSGGEVLLIETALMPGKGMVRVTGNLRQVMKESVEIALTYVRSRMKDLNIAPEVFEQHNLHVHFPAGAVPKDGPSAGITITTALIGVLTGRRSSSKVAMTGELTLRGEVTAIGGLREKIVAAKSFGFKTIIVPASNAKDVDEIPDGVLKGLTIVYAEHYEDVEHVALQKRPVTNAVPQIQRKSGPAKQKG